MYLYLLINEKVLDVCCGTLGDMWFDKKDSRALFLDKRNITYTDAKTRAYKKLEIKPDVIGNFTNIQQEDNSFWHIVFDPPHLRRNKLGEITKRYGMLNENWKEEIRAGV